MTPLNLITKKKVLVVVNCYGFDVDKLIAAITLSSLLATDENNSIDLLLSNWTGKTEVATLAVPVGVNIINLDKSTYTKVTIPKDGAEVKNVRWQQTGDELVLMVQYDQGKLVPEKIIVNKNADYYSEVFVVGSKDKLAAELMLGDKKNLLNTAVISTLSVHAPKAEYAQNHYVYGKTNSYCAAVYLHALSKGYSINADAATDLLKGIAWKTYLMSDLQPELFSIANQLVKLGGDLSAANNKVVTGSNEKQLALNARIVNSTKVENKIAFSVLSSTEAALIKSLESLNPFKNPLATDANLHASFVLIPTDTDKTLVWTSNKQGKYNFSQMFKNLNWAGTNFHGQMQIFSNTEKALETLKKYFPQSSQNTPKSSSTPENKPTNNKPPAKITSFRPAIINNLNQLITPQPA